MFPISNSTKIDQIKTQISNGDFRRVLSAWFTNEKGDLVKFYRKDGAVICIINNNFFRIVHDDLELFNAQHN